MRRYLLPAFILLAILGAALPASAQWQSAPWGPDACRSIDATRQIVLTCPPYNAVAGDVGDQAAAFQAAFTDGVGKEIICPDGAYRINGSLTLTGASTRLIGLGKCFLRFNVAGPGITFNNSGGLTQRISVENVYIQSLNAGGTTGLALTNVSYVTLKDILIDSSGVSGAWTTGLALSAVENLTILGGWIYGAAATGITNLVTIDDVSRGNQVYGLSLTGGDGKTASGYVYNGGAGMQVFGGVVQGGFGTAGLLVDGSTSGSPQAGFYGVHVEITNGAIGYKYTRGAANAHVAIYNPRGGSVDVGATASATGFSVYGGRLEGVTLSSNALAPVIAPSTAGTITDNGAVGPTILLPGDRLTLAGRRTCSVLFSQGAMALTTAGTAGEESLKVVDIPAGLLAKNDDYLEIQATFSSANNANAKTGRVRITTDGGGASGTVVATCGAAASAAASICEATIARTSATSQDTTGKGFTVSTALLTFTRTAPSLTLANPLDIVVTGQTATSAGDITLQSLLVKICK